MKKVSVKKIERIANKKKLVNAKKQAINSYRSDYFELQRNLLYGKSEVIRELNRNVPYFLFPGREFKIIDISFTIVDYGIPIIHLYMKDGDEEVITMKNGNIEMYCRPGLCKVGPGVSTFNDFLVKSDYILRRYFILLEKFMNKYPNMNVCFGRNNSLFTLEVSNSKKIFSRKY